MLQGFLDFRAHDPGLFLPVLYHLPVFCSSAIPLILIAESVSVLLGAGPILYYTLLVLVHNSLVVEDWHCVYL